MSVVFVDEGSGCEVRCDQPGCAACEPVAANCASEARWVAARTLGWGVAEDREGVPADATWRIDWCPAHRLDPPAGVWRAVS
jgi:hypothetical protein